MALTNSTNGPMGALMTPFVHQQPFNQMAMISKLALEHPDQFASVMADAGVRPPAPVPVASGAIGEVMSPTAPGGAANGIPTPAPAPMPTPAPMVAPASPMGFTPPNAGTGPAMATSPSATTPTAPMSGAGAAGMLNKIATAAAGIKAPTPVAQPAVASAPAPAQGNPSGVNNPAMMQKMMQLLAPGMAPQIPTLGQLMMGK